MVKQMHNQSEEFETFTKQRQSLSETCRNGGFISVFFLLSDAELLAKACVGGDTCLCRETKKGFLGNCRQQIC